MEAALIERIAMTLWRQRRLIRAAAPVLMERGLMDRKHSKDTFNSK